MLLVIAAPAHAQVGEYTPCEKTGDALIVEVSGAPCDAARAVAAALTDVPAAGVEAVLRAQGWAPVRATATRFEESYELFAVRGRAGAAVLPCSAGGPRAALGGDVRRHRHRRELSAAPAPRSRAVTRRHAASCNRTV